ncbi:MAG: hypothetical protein DBY35_12240 [Bacteroidales bacterium]|nr:MAG: hypothetical protein DBY35_12240 [Bacteroidales bacterium]
MKKKIMTLAIAACLAFAMPAVTFAQSADDDLTSSMTVSAPSMKAVPQGIELTVTDGETHHFYIYSITGQMVKSMDVVESVTVDLPQGYYIVKCKDWSKKIVVR